MKFHLLETLSYDFAAAKNCDIGRSCKAGCVSRAKECDVPHSPEVKPAVEKLVKTVKGRKKKETVPPLGPIYLPGFSEDLQPLIAKDDKLGRHPVHKSASDYDPEIAKVREKLTVAEGKGYRGEVYTLNKRIRNLQLLREVPGERRQELVDALDKSYALGLVVNRAGTGSKNKQYLKVASGEMEEAGRKVAPIYYGEDPEPPLPAGNPSVRGRVNSAIPEGARSEVGQPIEGNFRNFLEEGVVTVHISPEAFSGVLQSGSMRNMYHPDAIGSVMKEESIENQDEYKQERRRIEREVLFIPDSTPGDERPVYGTIDSRSRLRSNAGASVLAENYGAIQIEMKPEVKERSTYTLGDSFNEASTASPILNPRRSTGTGVSLREDIPSSTALGFYLEHEDYGVSMTVKGYIEAQIFGGVRLEDIQTVRFPKGSVPPGLIEEMERKGIDYEEILPWPKD